MHIFRHNADSLGPKCDSVVFIEINQVYKENQMLLRMKEPDRSETTLDKDTSSVAVHLSQGCHQLTSHICISRVPLGSWIMCCVTV